MGEYSVYCTGKITLPFRPTIAITSLAGYLFLLYYRNQPTTTPSLYFWPHANASRWWCRTADANGLPALKHKKRNRVWTTEERFELVNRVLSGESFTSAAISAGLAPARLYIWVHKYKEMGYIGLIDCRKKWKPKEPHMNKHKHNQPGKHKESEHEELICLRTENKLFKAENAAKKK